MKQFLISLTVILGMASCEEQLLEKPSQESLVTIALSNQEIIPRIESVSGMNLSSVNGRAYPIDTDLEIIDFMTLIQVMDNGTPILFGLWDQPVDKIEFNMIDGHEYEIFAKQLQRHPESSGWGLSGDEFLYASWHDVTNSLTSNQNNYYLNRNHYTRQIFDGQYLSDYGHHNVFFGFESFTQDNIPDSIVLNREMIGVEFNVIECSDPNDRFEIYFEHGSFNHLYSINRDTTITGAFPVSMVHINPFDTHPYKVTFQMTVFDVTGDSETVSVIFNESVEVESMDKIVFDINIHEIVSSGEGLLITTQEADFNELDPIEIDYGHGD